jgi:peptidoglycan/xylan/chitin deacetylase (PgdA/CDA1 family)
MPRRCRGSNQDLGRRAGGPGTIASTMSLLRSLRLGVLALAGYASSCAVRVPDAPPRLIPAAEAVTPSPLAVDPTVLDPSVLTVEPGPMPFNADADLDRAGVLAEGAENSGEIAFTFDDGPAAETTSEVLRILAAHKVKGAFFLTGRRLGGSGVVAEMNRGVARSIVVQGHAIGNHGLDHLGLNRRDDVFNAFQIDESERLIVEATGVPVHYFRPPFGKLNASSRAILAARRDELVMWTIDAQDTKESDPEKLTTRLVQQIIFAGQGIVLLHDLRGPSVRALSLLLDWLEAHPRDPVRGTGYAIVDLPTYLAHAAARPWPYRTRLELYHAREKIHAAERGLTASRPKLTPLE